MGCRHGILQERAVLSGLELSVTEKEELQRCDYYLCDIQWIQRLILQLIVVHEHAIPCADFYPCIMCAHGLGLLERETFTHRSFLELSLNTLGTSHTLALCVLPFSLKPCLLLRET